MPVTAVPPTDETPLETPNVPEPDSEPPSWRFNYGPTPTDTMPTQTYKVTSQYVEEEWLAFIGPTALLIARRMDNTLASQTNAACDVKSWSRQLGVPPIELHKALNRLARYGLGEWHGDQTFLLRRHWPTVPLAISTPPHRDALLGLAD